MERGHRVLLAAGVAACPALMLLAMLFFQLKTIDIANQDVEAELRLGRQRREKRTLEEQLEAAEGQGPSAKSSPAPESEAPS